MTDTTTDIDPGVAEQILGSVKIPTLPEAASNLLALCQDDRAGAGEIVRIVELDPALTARLLKVANSSYFGQRYQVSTLTRAAVVLGNERLKVAALGFYLSAGWEKLGHTGFDLREFWRDNILRGCLGLQLARAMELRPSEQAFLVGLLGDIGTLILVTHFGAEYLSVWEQCRGDFMLRSEMERGVFHTDHAQVAKALAKRWNFPELLVTALGERCAKPPLVETTDPATLLWQLSYFCGAVPFATDRQTAKLRASLRGLAISAFGLSFEALSEVFTNTVEQFNVLCNVFAGLSPAACDIDTLMEEAAKLIQSFDPQVTEHVTGL